MKIGGVKKFQFYLPGPIFSLLLQPNSKVMIEKFTYILLCGIIILLPKVSGSEFCA